MADELDDETLARMVQRFRLSGAMYSSPIVVAWGVRHLEPQEFKAPTWWTEVTNKMSELLRLPQGWDSYGARRVRDDCIAYALNTVLAKCMNNSSPAPAVVPLNSGGIMLEWHCRQIDLEISVEEPGQVRAFFADAEDKVEYEFSVDDDSLTKLAEVIAKLAQRA